MIEHKGRNSGQLYRTVIEVAGRYPEANEWIVASGWGPGADWYRNLRAGMLDAVWIGSKRRPAEVRFLGIAEASEVIRLYEAAHPRAARILFRSMGVSHDGTPDSRAEMMKAIPMVSFKV